MKTKFRAWDKHQNKMLYDGFAICPHSPTWGPDLLRHEPQSIMEGIQKLWQKEYKGDVMAAYIQPTVLDWSDWYGLENLTVMQWTGLKDEEGKDIYAGDILNHGDHFYSEVFWSEGDAGFKLRERGIVAGESRPREHDMNYLTFSPTVLGNVFENPNLIDDEKES